MTRTVPPPPQRLLLLASLPQAAPSAPFPADPRLAAVLGALGSSSRELEIEVLWTSGPQADGAALRSAFGYHAVAKQTGATAGDRLGIAFSERFFFHKTEKIVAIAVDDPPVSRELVDHTFALLDSCEWVIGPAEEGGYYLIGSRGATFDNDVFRRIGDASGDVLAETLASIAEWGNSVALLPQRSRTAFFESLRPRA